MGPAMSTTTTRKEVTVSPAKKVAEGRRRKHRRTYSVDRAFAVKPFERKRPKKTLNSFSKYVKKLRFQVRTIHNDKSCLTGKVQDLEDLSDKALKQYNRLKNLQITVDPEVSSDDEQCQTRDLKWRAMDLFENEIISLHHKVWELTSILNQERAGLKESREKRCCKFCSGRSKAKGRVRKSVLL